MTTIIFPVTARVFSFILFVLLFFVFFSHLFVMALIFLASSKIHSILLLEKHYKISTYHRTRSFVNEMRGSGFKIDYS